MSTILSDWRGDKGDYLSRHDALSLWVTVLPLADLEMRDDRLSKKKKRCYDKIEKRSLRCQCQNANRFPYMQVR